jgi:hypothetical protein
MPSIPARASAAALRTHCTENTLHVPRDYLKRWQQRQHVEEDRQLTVSERNEALLHLDKITQLLEVRIKQRLTQRTSQHGVSR